MNIFLWIFIALHGLTLILLSLRLGYRYLPSTTILVESVRIEGAHRAKKVLNGGAPIGIVVHYRQDGEQSALIGLPVRKINDQQTSALNDLPGSVLKIHGWRRVGLEFPDHPLLLPPIWIFVVMVCVTAIPAYHGAVYWWTDTHLIFQIISILFGSG